MNTGQNHKIIFVQCPPPYIGTGQWTNMPCYGNVPDNQSVTVTFERRVTLW
jgi:hypothetical protein